MHRGFVLSANLNKLPTRGWSSGEAARYFDLKFVLVFREQREKRPAGEQHKMPSGYSRRA